MGMGMAAARPPAAAVTAATMIRATMVTAAMMIRATMIRATWVMAANAVAGVVEFRGGFCLLTVTTSCASASWNVGDCLLLRYSPPNLGTNGPTTEVSVLGQSFGDSYSLASGSLVGTTYKTVAGV